MALTCWPRQSGAAKDQALNLCLYQSHFETVLYVILERLSSKTASAMLWPLKFVLVEVERQLLAKGVGL